MVEFLTAHGLNLENPEKLRLDTLRYVEDLLLRRDIGLGMGRKSLACWQGIWGFMVAIAPMLFAITPVYGESTRPLAIFVNGEGSPMPQLDAKLQQLEAEVWDIAAMNAVGGETLPTRWTVKNRDYPGTVLWLEGQNALNQIPPQRPVWIIGRGSAAQAMLQLLPRIERRIQLVAMVDLPLELPLSSAMELDNQDASNSANNLDNVDVFLNYFQLPQAITAPRRKADDCDSVNCYEFDGRGDRPTAEEWIQGDLLFQLNSLINAGTPEPITIILTVNQPPASPEKSSDI